MAESYARRADIRRKRLAAFGIITPTLDVLITIGLAALDPKYSHAHQYISELGEPGRPYALAFNAWCVVYGVLFAGFAVALGRGLKSRALLLALLAIAVCSVVGGLFPCDPGGTVQSATAEVHLIIGYVALAAIFLAPILAWGAMKENAQWHGFGTFSLACAGLLAAAIVWLATCHFSGREQPGCAVGAAQRVILGIQYAWMIVLSVRLWRLPAE
jgi:hypothetical membrane protein